MANELVRFRSTRTVVILDRLDDTTMTTQDECFWCNAKFDSGYYNHVCPKCGVTVTVEGSE